MTFSELLTEKGFKEVQTNRFVREAAEPEGLTLLLELTDDGLHLRVPCASPVVDCEPEIEEAVRKLVADGTCRQVSFHTRMLELSYDCTDEESRRGALQAGMEIVDKADRQFDLLPVCMECGRLIRTRAVCHQGRLKTVCGVCADSLDLHIRHEKLNQRNFEKAKKAPQKRPTLKFVKAGLFAGLWACLVGLAATVIYLALPIILFASPVAGATAGYLTVRYLRRVYPKVTLHGFLLGNLTALLTIVIVSPITTTILTKGFELLMFNTAQVHNPLTEIASVNPLPYLLFGLIVMLMTEVMFIFWLPEEAADF